MTHHTFAPLVRAATSASRVDEAARLAGADARAPADGLARQQHALRHAHGRAEANRGYTYSSDEHQQEERVKDRLVPDVFRRSLLKKKEERKRLTMIHQEEDEVVEEHAAPQSS